MATQLLTVWFQTILMTNFSTKPQPPRPALLSLRAELRGFACGPQPLLTMETAYMKKLLAVLVAGLFAASAFAQAPATAPAPTATPAAAQAPAPVAKTKATKATKTAKKKGSKKVAKKKTTHKAA